WFTRHPRFRFGVYLCPGALNVSVYRRGTAAPVLFRASSSLLVNGQVLAWVIVAAELAAPFPQSSVPAVVYALLRPDCWGLILKCSRYRPASFVSRFSARKYRRDNSNSAPHSASVRSVRSIRRALSRIL